MQSLLDKSLVRRMQSGRFLMLETIREFAAERLDPERRDQLLRRLLDALTETFQGANLRHDSPGPPAMELAQEERPNVDVALRWATEAGQASAGLRLLWMLEMYWGTNDPGGGRERLNALLVGAVDDLDPGEYARALRFRGGTYDMTNENALAELEYERGIELFRSLGDEDEADHLRHRIAYAALRQGDLERAVQLASELLELDRRRGNLRDEAVALNILGTAAFTEGDRTDGVRLAHESASVAARAGFAWWRGVTLLQTAEWLMIEGDLEAAQHDFVEGLQTLESVSDQVNLPIALAGGAAIAAAQLQAERAGTLWGALEAVAEREPRPTTTAGLRECEEYVERVQGEEFEAGRARGRTLTLKEGVQYALSTLD